jgi:hypothetical protein
MDGYLGLLDFDWLNCLGIQMALMISWIELVVLLGIGSLTWI